MAVDDIYRIDHFMSYDDREVSTSLHWRVSDDFPGTELENAEIIVEATATAFWAAFWQNLACQQLLYLRTRGQKIHPTRETIFESSTYANQAGEVTGDGMNGTTAVLIAEYTVQWSARTRGRMYLPGLAEGSATNGRIHSSEYDAIQAAADLLFPPELVVTGPPAGKLVTVVFSAAKPNAVPPLDADWAGPIRPVVRPRIATQRRRRTNVKSVFPIL